MLYTRFLCCCWNAAYEGKKQDHRPDEGETTEKSEGDYYQVLIIQRGLIGVVIIIITTFIIESSEEQKVQEVALLYLPSSVVIIVAIFVVLQISAIYLHIVSAV